MLVIFAGRGALLVRLACMVLPPLSTFLGLALYFSGLRWWGIIILVFATVVCLHWPIVDRMASAAAADGGLPVQQHRQPVPEVAPPSHGGGVTHGLGASAIAALPAYAYEKKGGIDDCAVCLGELQRGEEVKQLPACAHLFHDGCIDAWLKSHVTCPVCRCPVDTALPAAAAEVVVRIQ